MSRTPKNSAPPTRQNRPSARRSPPRVRPRNRRPAAQRATRPLLVRLFSLASLPELPLPLCDDEVPSPCPKRRFRSWYRPRSRQALRRYGSRLKASPPQSAAARLHAAFSLLDWSPLRARLIRTTLVASAQGETPFDPLSLLLICLWKITAHRSWPAVAEQLADPEQGLYWRRLAGFRDGDTPGEGTLRAFRHRLPQETFNQVQRLFLAALERLGLLPDPAETHGYLLVGDGQRHRAHSQHRCHHAVNSCYEETSPTQPRPCPAHQESKGRYFCACDTDTCRERCALAPHLDREAGYSVYSREKAGPAPPSDTEGTARAPAPDGVDGVWGYRSVAARLVDPRLQVAWNVHTDLLPANADEGTFFPRHLAGAYANLPHPELGYVVYDSAASEQRCLDAVYDRGGVPLFALKADPSDDSRAKQQERGYDERGYPLCHQGFRMTWQGLDRHHRPLRARWACQHACRKSAAGAVADCAYLGQKRGQILYVQRTLPGGNYRLARLIPPGSRRWKQIMGWRNTAEGRNSALEQKGLKRLPDYGLPHGAFLIGWADVLENLSTLARLVLEATALDERVPVLEQAKRPQPIEMEPDAPGKESAEDEEEEETVG